MIEKKKYALWAPTKNIFWLSLNPAVAMEGWTPERGQLWFDVSQRKKCHTVCLLINWVSLCCLCVSMLQQTYTRTLDIDVYCERTPQAKGELSYLSSPHCTRCCWLLSAIRLIPVSDLLQINHQWLSSWLLLLPGTGTAPARAGLERQQRRCKNRVNGLAVTWR